MLAAPPFPATFRFGDFQLDRVQQRLRRGDVEMPLRAKSFALLCYLAENCGRLITREELLGAVWPGAAVSASVVRISIAEVREALGDDAETPRFVETVGRRGYRFLADLARSPAARPAFVGREAELARLRELFERCGGRGRQVVFVGGEPGIGKTALVERFLAAVRGAGLARIAQGQCVELHGATEPYLPVLELLERLCQSEDRETVIAALERWAPSWLLQMPGIIDASAAEAIGRRVPTPTRERMLRELADTLEVLTRTVPLVLVLEDLHWSDASTVDLLAYVAQRTTPARLLIIATYRPVDVIIAGHRLRETVRDLVARGRAVEVALELLTPRDTDSYLAQLFDGTPIDPRLGEAMHGKSDGNPLFLATMVEYMLERGILAVIAGRWQMGPGGEVLPPSLRELVARELDALDETDRIMVAAASVVGVEFDAVSVAAATERPVGEVEERCNRLAGRGQLLHAVGASTWPDGALGGTYAFLHAVYRDAVYARLLPAQRTRMHRAVGARIESGWERQPAAVAAALAAHFERGSDWPRAIHHHLAAVEASKQRLADREVVAHCETVLSLLPRLPPSPERERIEMMCSLDLGSSLLAVRGYGSQEVRPLFIRARELALALDLPQVEIVARGGLYTVEVMGGDQRCALELARDLLAMAERFPLPLFVMIGHTTVGCSHYNLGNFVDAREHVERARAAWEPGFPRLQLDQKVLFLGIGALVLLTLGDSTEAERWLAELITYTGDLDDPINVAHACDLIAGYRNWAGDREEGRRWADRSLELAIEHAFPAQEALAKIQKGHAVADVSLQREGFTALQAIGYRVDIPAHRLQMAETLIETARWDEARDELYAALAAVEATGEARHLAEINRLRAACARAAGRLDDAAAALQAAIAVAHRQQAVLFEQRARADLAALQSLR